MLRPTIINRNRWRTVPRKNAVPLRIRKLVLERDDNTCTSCGHKAMSHMHIHHLDDQEDDSLPNLSTVCPACHAVLHFGRSMGNGTIEIWKSPLSQLEIVRRTREGVRNGLTLAAINLTFAVKRGRFPPDSPRWPNDLLRSMEDDPEASLPEPLCAVFVNFNQWQIEA